MNPSGRQRRQPDGTRSERARSERARSERARRAFSLLEMLLALAILGTALGLLAQIAGTGTDAAREARDLSQARLIAQGKLAEILTTGFSPQSLPPTPIDAIDSESTTPFEVQVDVAPAPLDGLLAIRVSVQALNPDGGPPLATFSLTRWMVDPLLGLAELAAEEKAMREEMAAL